MTEIQSTQWDALAEAFAGGSHAVPADSWTVADVVAASQQRGRPLQRTAASQRVREALRHGLIVMVQHAHGVRPARYVLADGVTPETVAALFRGGAQA